MNLLTQSTAALSALSIASQGDRGNNKLEEHSLGYDTPPIHSSGRPATD